MNKSINVLSIDFTFFQNVSAETVNTCYPDGHTLSTNMSRFVWSSYYANPTSADKIAAVTPRMEMLDEMRNKIRTCKNKDIPVLVSTNHADIYDFIRNMMSEKGLIKLNLTNVDMYHDMINNNYDLDCGNWLKILSDEYDVTATWIANPISRELFGMKDPAYNRLPLDFKNSDFTNLDAIFLCRNDTMLPPHLDVEFDKLLRFLCKTFSDVKGEAAIKSPRNMDELINNQKRFYKLATGDDSLSLNDKRINYLRKKSPDEIKNELSHKSISDVKSEPEIPMMTDAFANMFNNVFETNIAVENKTVTKLDIKDMDRTASYNALEEIIRSLPQVEKITEYIKSESQTFNNDPERLNRIVALNNAFATLYDAIIDIRKHNYITE